MAGSWYYTNMAVPQENKNDIPDNQVAQRCKNCTGYEDKLDMYEPSQESSELAAMEKHEIITDIARHLGNDAFCLGQAEELFNQIKYHVTDYVLKHEYNLDNRLSVQIAMWLEERKKPQSMEPLGNIIQNYLKPDSHTNQGNQSW